MYPTELKTIQYPDPILSKRAEDVTVFDEELKLFCNRLITHCHRSIGVGMAAPQVGVSKRIFVTCWQKTDRVWINPTLASMGGKVKNIEGCLSFPGLQIPITRPNNILVHYQDMEGNRHEEHIERVFLSIIVQHEIDHLNGKTMPDHVPAESELRPKIEQHLASMRG